MSNEVLNAHIRAGKPCGDGASLDEIADRAGEYLGQVTDQLVAANKRIAELEAWKESAMSVMPDFQAIGKLLRVPLGESVHDKILPNIQALQAKVDELRNHLVDKERVVRQRDEARAKVRELEAELEAIKDDHAHEAEG